MGKYSYVELFNRSPETFLRFGALVNNPGAFYAFLQEHKLLSNVRTVLSIGAGEGDLEIRLMKDLGIDVEHLDPTPAYCETYRRKLIDNKLEDHSLGIHCVRFEEYAADRKFDFVFALHCWYAIGFNESAIQKAMDCRGAKGITVICLASEVSFDVLLGDVVHEPGEKYFTAEGLSRWLIEKGYQHQFLMSHHPISFNRLVLNGDFTADGRAMFEFLSRTPFDEITDIQKENGLTLLQNFSRDGVLNKQAGCLIFQG